MGAVKLRVQGSLVTLSRMNITQDSSILLSCTVFCMVVTAILVYYVPLYSIIILIESYQLLVLLVKHCQYVGYIS
jgi:hypothetical protein